MDIKSLILIAGGVMIVAVILHGIWIAWRSRRENLPLDIARDLIPDDFDEEARFRHELPNGGARLLPGDDSADPSAHATPPILLNKTAPETRSPQRRVNSRREPQPLVDDPVAVRRATDAELFGNGDSLITENRHGTHASQPDTQRPAARVSGGYASTNGSHAPAPPIPAAAKPESAPKAAVDDTAPRRPRVQNVTIPANAQPVARRGTTPPPAEPVEPRDAEVDRDLVISIFLLARPGQTFTGHALLKALRARGLKYANMNIFHRIDPVSKVNLYSVANAVNPGTFDLSKLDELQTPGLVFFMQLEGLDHPLSTFDDMRRVASELARTLDGELKDEHRSVVGTQTFDHYRERIAEYSRRRLSRRA